MPPETGYALFSRRQGWINGKVNPIKTFRSNIINNEHACKYIYNNRLIGKKGEIIKAHLIVSDPKNKCMELSKLCKIYPNWYLYHENEIISAIINDYY